ncbi:MAG TPA: methyltransferase domain-containing protein [Candidatus Udaeobacter sp.]|nr:methyltransferase domain-containing protein [Candidatus Udaeobacter sp.]
MAEARPSSPPGDYVLGTGDDELLRLGFQHQVWSAAAAAHWERARFGPGQTLLDVGSGPGYATLDLARLVGPSGKVLAVDRSPGFLNHLEGAAQALGLRQIQTCLADLAADGAWIPPGTAHGAYARWVLCFVADPARVIAAVARALRPGGRFAIADYYRYAAISVAPVSPAFRRVIDAVEVSWGVHGGDPAIGLRLPELLTQHGFVLEEVRPLIRIAHPGTALWEWPTTFFRNFLPVLRRADLITSEDEAAFARDWAERSRNPAARFFSPPMVEIVATKA